MMLRVDFFFGLLRTNNLHHAAGDQNKTPTFYSLINSRWKRLFSAPAPGCQPALRGRRFPSGAAGVQLKVSSLLWFM